VAAVGGPPAAPALGGPPLARQGGGAGAAPAERLAGLPASGRACSFAEAALVAADDLQARVSGARRPGRRRRLARVLLGRADRAAFSWLSAGVLAGVLHHEIALLVSPSGG